MPELLGRTASEMATVELVLRESHDQWLNRVSNMSSLFLCGDKVTLADFCVYEYLAKIENPSDTLQEYIDRIGKIARYPGVKRGATEDIGSM